MNTENTLNAASNSKFANNALLSVAERIAEQEQALDVLSPDAYISAKEFESAKKSATKRIKENKALLSLLTTSKEFCSFCAQHKIDFEKLVRVQNANTRENKKRFQIIAELLITGSFPRNAKAESNLLPFLALELDKRKEFSLRDFQRAMFHETTTQARYFFDFLEFVNAGKRFKDHSLESSSDSNKIEINPESGFVKKILALYE